MKMRGADMYDCRYAICMIADRLRLRGGGHDGIIVDRYGG